MVERLILKGNNSSILLEKVSDIWINCFLVTSNENNEKIFLGAQTQNYVVKQLLSYFEDSSHNPSEILDGYPVSWIMTLSETHYVLYCSKDEDIFLLFWQDSREKSFGVVEIMEVHKMQVAEWITNLRNFA